MFCSLVVRLNLRVNAATKREAKRQIYARAKQTKQREQELNKAAKGLNLSKKREIKSSINLIKARRKSRKFKRER